MSSSNAGVFIVWRIFQRRSESLARVFNLEVNYYYCSWEEKSKFHKMLSYVFKTVRTIKKISSSKPSVIFIQLPPTPVLYIAIVYCKLVGCKLVADCHNAMIYSRWCKWPLAKSLLREADILLVHNKDVEIYAKQFRLNAITLRDPLPVLTTSYDLNPCKRYGLECNHYIIVPWSFSADEPIEELIQAAVLMPDVHFVMTWFKERLHNDIKNSLPPNLILTGYLDDNDFNSLFSLSTAALVLTTREGTQPSAASEAIVLGVPLIVSDLKTTRQLYEDMPLYTTNTAEGIRNTVQEAINAHSRHKAKILQFRDKFSKQLDKEITEVKSSLGLST